jgi:hypothetical protein
VFVTGLSGNGKTMSILQACAEAKKECIRVNVTIETDEDDLLGGYRLKDGQTVWQNGPVIEAMERGALLLLDEIDLASNKIMCLQPILESTGKKDTNYVNKLVTWADVIRKTYFEGGVDEIISTRRLVHIVQAYSIFSNKVKAIELCTNRFDEDTKTSFVDLYTKVDAGATADQIIESQRQSEVAAQSQTDSNDGEEEAVAI